MIVGGSTLCRMRRLAAFRLTLTIAAFVALSLDSATKVLHGFAHSRDALAHHSTHGTPSAADSAPDAEHSVADSAEDHDALHHSGASNIFSKTPLALVATPRVPVQDIGGTDKPVRFPTPRGGLASVRAGPDQPRAPPIG